MPGTREPAEALLIDLDGVLRHYDAAVDRAVEERFGLAPGTIFRTAMEPDRYRTLVTGGWTRAEWLAEVASALGIPAGALADLTGYRGHVDPEVLDFVREVRAARVPVALCSNAPRDLGDDLERLGLAARFDAVVTSSLIGHAKPHPEFYKAACGAVGVPAERALFVDDSDRNVRGARAAGLPAYRWNGHADLRYLRATLNLDGA